MGVITKHLRTAAFFAVLVGGMVALPALARLDVYRCTSMQSSHVGRCCVMHGEHARETGMRAARRTCCVLQSKGTEPAPAQIAGIVPVVGAPAQYLVAVLDAPVPVNAAPREHTTRSRAPPSAPLWLHHSTFLL